MMDIFNFDQVVVDISKKDGKIYCKVSLPAKSSYFPHRVVVTTSDVVRLLSNRGESVIDTIKEARLSNKSAKTTLEGEWVFLQKAASVPKKKNIRTRASKTSNTKQK